jgi:hypothetical protein
MYYRRAGLAVATLLACFLSTSRADTLEMPETQNGDGSPAQSTEPTTANMPVRGMSMSQVERRFGQPLNKLAPVGDPPITRWVYGEYTVYFEGKYVIHAVQNRG